MKTDPKTIAPISVSHCNPVYVNGRVKYWNIQVVYNADLFLYRPDKKLLNVSELRRSLMQEPLYFEMITPVLNPKIYIPNRGHVSNARYDDVDGTTILGYSWRNGLFGRGAERADRFRTNMLAKIANNEKVK